MEHRPRAGVPRRRTRAPTFPLYLLLLVPFAAVTSMGSDCDGGSDDTPMDGGVPDAGMDGGLDGGTDGGFDGGTDGGFDGGTDGGFDGGMRDSGMVTSCEGFGSAIAAIASHLGITDCSTAIEPEIETFDHSADDIDPQPVADDHTTITTIIPTRVELDAAAIDRLFGTGDPAFPCDVGPNGLTICHEDLSPNQYFVTFVRTAGTIPTDDDTNHYQYGWVADKDLDSSNNYRGTSPYGDDLYDDTDTWLDIVYGPPPGPGFAGEALDATDGDITPTAIPFRVIIREDTIVYVVPRFTTSGFAFRVTAFRHPGDFGDPSGDFDGSVWPLVGEPLLPYP